MVKTNTSRVLFGTSGSLEQEMGSRALWSRGYYSRSVGDVTDQVILGYLAKQAMHHRCDSRLLASHSVARPDQFFDFRSFDHCVAESNCHLVCCAARHAPVLAAEFARPLMNYMLRIASRKFEVNSARVLDDHFHLFAALRPNQSPQEFALWVMNNTAYWLETVNPGGLKVWDAPAFWMPSAFIRTAGAVDSFDIRAHLAARDVDE